MFQQLISQIPSALNRSVVPKYRKHKPSGRAVVTLSGKDFYLGPHGSKVSIAEYDRLIGEWLAGGRQLPEATTGLQLSIVELIVAYRRHARQYYVRSDGSCTDEARLIDAAVAHVRRLYGRQVATEFGPKKLKAVRQSMINAGWARKHINKQIARVKRMFRWGTEEELVPPGVYQALQAVRDLPKNRTDVPQQQGLAPAGMQASQPQPAQQSLQHPLSATVEHYSRSKRIELCEDRSQWKRS